MIDNGNLRLPVSSQVEHRRDDERDFTDNGSLSVSNTEYGKFVCRILKAYERRVAELDIDCLVEMQHVAEEANAAVERAARTLHEEHGYSWTEIGLRLGISRQAARQRFGSSSY